MAIYTFLTDEDLKVAMKQYFIDQLTTDANILEIAEGAAFSQIKAELNSRYDLTLLFPSITEWDNATPFLADSYCYTAGNIYKAIQGSTNQDPASAPAYWKKDDPRDKMLVVMAANMTIYILTSRNKPSKLTQDMIDNYAAAAEYLEDVKNLKKNPDWPLLDGGATDIQWGSNEKLDHYY